MTTETSPLNRQPDKLDYTSPTQFRFMINQLPKVQFFTQSANIPAISLSELVIPTPYKDLPIIGDKVTFENLTITVTKTDYRRILEIEVQVDPDYIKDTAEEEVSSQRAQIVERANPRLKLMGDNEFSKSTRPGLHMMW